MTTKNKKDTQEITDAEADEVSLVDRPANKVPFLIVKNAGDSEDDEVPELELPLTADKLVELATHLEDSSSRLAALGKAFRAARSTADAKWRTDILEEISQVSAPFSEYVEKVETEEVSQPVDDAEANSEEGFRTLVSKLRETFWDATERFSNDNSAAARASANEVMDSLDSLIAKAVSCRISERVLAVGAEDIRKTANEVEDVDDLLHDRLKQLVLSVQPTSVVRRDAEATIVGLKKQLVELQAKYDDAVKQGVDLGKSLQKAVAVIQKREAPGVYAKVPNGHPEDVPSNDTNNNRVDWSTLGN